MNEFKELGLPESILKVIEEQGFEKPTEVQKKSIPLVLQGEDVIAGSATGSGKTLAFAAGILKNTVPGEGVQALILTPTRELAEQVSTALNLFSSYQKLKIISVYGGVSIAPQIREIEIADVVVGTPGRILDHLQRETLELDYVKTLVLDEADRMLDMGFIDDVDKIISQCNVKRQTLLFSATITSDIDYLAKKYLKDPKKVAVEKYVDPSKLKQVYYDVPDKMKFSLLVHLLKNEESDSVIVFCNTRKNTEFVVKNLKSADVEAYAIHGGMTQAKRNMVLEGFHRGNFKILVCTDVAARGLDIKGVSHVYNFDSPTDSKDYIHRIGRTARAGENGKAISILASRDYQSFNDILKAVKAEISEEKTPEVESVRISWVPERRGSGRFGGRGGSRSGGYGGSLGRSSRGGSRGGQGGRDNQRGGRGRRSASGNSRGPSRGGSSRGRSYGGGRSLRGSSRGGSRNSSRRNSNSRRGRY